MKCWNCSLETPDPFGGKISFREYCEACGSALHCCRNCIYYKTGLPNDCMIPNTEYVADRTKANFCDEFKLSGKGPTKLKDANNAAKRLFGDDIQTLKNDPKKRFNALFDDSNEQV